MLEMLREELGKVGFPLNCPNTKKISTLDVDILDVIQIKNGSVEVFERQLRTHVPRENVQVVFKTTQKWFSVPGALEVDKIQSISICTDNKHIAVKCISVCLMHPNRALRVGYNADDGRVRAQDEQ